jgi:hypothetical protein
MTLSARMYRRFDPPASIERSGPAASSRDLMLYSTEIIERPHNGTAVVRANGSIYYSPKPGFAGRLYEGAARCL